MDSLKCHSTDIKLKKHILVLLQFCTVPHCVPWRQDRTLQWKVSKIPEDVIDTNDLKQDVLPLLYCFPKVPGKMYELNEVNARDGCNFSETVLSQT